MVVAELHSVIKSPTHICIRRSEDDNPLWVGKVKDLYDCPFADFAVDVMTFSIPGIVLDVFVHERGEFPRPRLPEGAIERIYGPSYLIWYYETMLRKDDEKRAESLKKNVDAYKNLLPDVDFNSILDALKKKD